MSDQGEGNDSDEEPGSEEITRTTIVGLEEIIEEQFLSPRQHLLLQMYNELWKSIQRVERGMWSFIAAFAAIAVSMLAAFQQAIPLYYAALFSIIVAFWGMNLSVVSSRWFSRNIIQVQNVENRFLEEEDYGEIIPRYFDQPNNLFFKFNSITFSIVNFLGFSVTLVIVVISIYIPPDSQILLSNQTVILLLLIFGSSFTLYNLEQSWSAVQTFILATNGKDDLDDHPPDTDFPYPRLWWLLPIVLTTAIGLLSLIGSIIGQNRSFIGLLHRQLQLQSIREALYGWLLFWIAIPIADLVFVYLLRRKYD